MQMRKEEVVGEVKIERFSFPTLHVEDRKTYFMKHTTPFTLCVVRDDAKKVLFIKGEDILKCKKIKKSNKYVKTDNKEEQEEFYNVHLKNIEVRYEDLE